MTLSKRIDVWVLKVATRMAAAAALCLIAAMWWGVGGKGHQARCEQRSYWQQGVPVRGDVPVKALSAM